MQSSSQIPVADVLCIYQQYGDHSNEQISEHIITYQSLPESLPVLQKHLVDLIWSGVALPIVTISVHVTSALIWLVWI